MKSSPKPGSIAVDEQREAEGVRSLIGGARADVSPPDTYWTNLLIRTNRRIDEASSGKAISISWAARVAIPGVLAIISFMVGLHYYVPNEPKKVSSLTSVVRAFSDEAIDSLLLGASRFDRLNGSGFLSVDPLEVPDEQMAEYYIATAKPGILIENLSNEQINELLTALDERLD